MFLVVLSEHLFLVSSSFYIYFEKNIIFFMIPNLIGPEAGEGGATFTALADILIICRRQFYSALGIL